MRRLQLVLAIVVLTAVGSAWLAERSRSHDPRPPAFAAPKRIAMEPLAVERGPHALEGRVVDADGAPAPGTTVRLRPLDGAPPAAPPLALGGTDADGRFALEGLLPGRYEATLVRPGTPVRTLAVDVPAPGDVAWELPPAWEELPALPPVVRSDLAGRLRPPPGLDPDGWPLAGYEVALLPQGEDAAWRGAFLRRAPVDAEGRFRFDALAEAAYRLVALPPWAAGGSWPLVADVRIDHGAAREAASEGDVEGRIELSLAAGELAGRLVDPRGRPIEGALVRVTPRGAPSEPWPPASTDAAGELVVRDLPPGAYDVELVAGAARVMRIAVVGAGERTVLDLAPVDPGR